MSEIDLQLPHGTTHKQYIVDLKAQLAAARAEIVRLNDLRKAEMLVTALEGGRLNSSRPGPECSEWLCKSCSN